jgi:hypothetical protein
LAPLREAAMHGVIAAKLLLYQLLSLKTRNSCLSVSERL